MTPKVNVRLAAIAAAVVAFAMLSVLVTNSAAYNAEATGSNPSPESHLADYPATQQSAGAVLETAQASQLQNFQPGYVPQPSTQGTYHDSLDLPQVAPQSSQTPTLELPRSHGQDESLELPTARQPQTAVGRISVTVTNETGRWIQDVRTQDLTVYEDGIQRPILGLQRDADTPISIGIVVDTSGSMSWKLAAAEAALQHFVRTLNPNDQFFLIAFSDRAFLLQGFTDNPADLIGRSGSFMPRAEPRCMTRWCRGFRKSSKADGRKRRCW